MVAAFGWSIGDVVLAIKIIAHIIEAFDRQKGAKKQYARSCGFLRQLLPVLKRIKEQLLEDEDEDVREDLLQHSQAIKVAYDEFEAYLENKYDGLSSKSDPGRVTKVLKTIQWSLDDLHDKVQKLKDRISESVQIYNAWLTQEVLFRVTDIREMCTDLRASSTERDGNFKELSITLEQLKQQNEMLSKASNDYQLELAEEQKQSQNESTEAIQGQISEAEKSTKAALDALNELQAEILRGQNELSALAKQQQRLAEGEAEARRWESLQAEAQEDAARSEEAYKQRREEYQETSKAVGDVADGVADLTNDDRVRDISEKTRGATKLFGVFGGLLGSNNASNSSRSSGSTTYDRRPRPTQTPAVSAARQPLRPAPSVAISPPPQRSTRTLPQAPGPIPDLNKSRRPPVSPPGVNSSMNSVSSPPTSNFPREGAARSTFEQKENPPPLPTRPKSTSPSPTLQRWPSQPSDEGIRRDSATERTEVGFKPPLPARRNPSSPASLSPTLPLSRPPLPPRKSTPTASTKPEISRSVSGSSQQTLPPTYPAFVASPVATRSPSSPQVSSASLTSPPSVMRVNGWIQPANTVNEPLTNDPSDDEDRESTNRPLRSVKERARLFDQAPVMGLGRN